MPKFFLHHVDVINNQYVSGWCLNRLLPGVKVTLKIFVDDILIGEAKCNLPRKDVRKAGLHRTGDCGFMFQLPQQSVRGSANLKFLIKGVSEKLFSVHFEEVEQTLENTLPLFFMHIPKTAGTSFNNHVQSWFGLNQWHTHIETYTDDQIRMLAQPGCYLAGHLPLYKLKDIFPDLATLNLHSMLRDPIAQLHSHLAWIKGIGLHPQGQFFDSHPVVVQTLARKLQNQKVDTPAALSQFVNQLDGFEWDFFDNIQTRYFLTERPDQVRKIELGSALKNLKLFSSIGLTEEYQPYIESVSALYDRRLKAPSSQHNRSKVTPLFDLQSKEVRSALSPLIEHDQTLYEAVSASAAVWKSTD